MAELELCCMTVRQASLPELITIAAKYGFGAVTTTTRLYDASPMGDADLRRLLVDRGMRVSYVDGLITALPGTPPPRPGDATEGECYRIAEALGATAINVVHINGTPTPMTSLTDALGAVCERAAGRGLNILVEFLPGTGIPDLPTVLELVRGIGATNLRVLLDSWHLARSGGDAALVESGAELIGALQLSDRTRAQDRQPYVPMTGRLLPGDGELPLADLVAPVLNAHPRTPVGIEVISDEMRALTPDAAASAAAAALHRLLRRGSTPVAEQC